MWRCAVGKSVEEKSEAFAKLLFAEAERFEEALLNILAVNPDAARAELVAVEYEVVALGANFPRSGFEFFQVFVHDAGERMLRANPGFVGFAPLKEREASDPEKFPLGFVDCAEGLDRKSTRLNS